MLIYFLTFVNCCLLVNAARMNESPHVYVILLSVGLCFAMTHTQLVCPSRFRVQVVSLSGAPTQPIVLLKLAVGLR